jgi:hypothetical protein
MMNYGTTARRDHHHVLVARSSRIAIPPYGPISMHRDETPQRGRKLANDATTLGL